MKLLFTMVLIWTFKEQQDQKPEEIKTNTAESTATVKVVVWAENKEKAIIQTPTLNYFSKNKNTEKQGGMHRKTLSNIWLCDGECNAPTRIGEM